MSWIVYALVIYLAASYGLVMYLAAKLLLGWSMRVLVGPRSLRVTWPADRALVDTQTGDAADAPAPAPVAPHRTAPRRMAA